jgi:hypothetical protein
MEDAMRPLAFAALSLGLLTGCFNGRANLDGQVGGFDAGDMKFAFFGLLEGSGADFDDDGLDDSVAILQIAITDLGSLCDDLGNISVDNDPSLLGDVQMITLGALVIKSNSDEDALEDGDILVNNGDSFLGLQFEVQQGGANVFDANDDGSTSLEIKGISGGSLRGEITTNLEFIDANNNIVSVPLSGSFSADRCAALDSIGF